MSTLEDLIKQLKEQPTWSDHDINNFAGFIRAKRKDMKFYQIADIATGDTFLIIKWPHKVPGLTVYNDQISLHDRQFEKSRNPEDC